ncbi:hypothetical protein C1645_499664 [Glomus cerebriforme]|uniref:Uncharacterized protein n=1 Tax=Glomus cerebriforme TaxID=658196 RepID=A0A397TAE9_9GLOM|nr:hypothetical protein C1645_499664 [Glomus cerebriforme]
MELINKGPKSPYQKLSRKAFFSYLPGKESFQQGYLGVDKATISGIFQLRYPDDKPVFAKKIQLSFVGKEYVFFAGALNEENENKKDDFDGNDSEDEDDNQFEEDEEVDTTEISTYTAKRRIFGSSIVIWRSKNKGQYEELKMLDLPFKFTLPSNLPGSFTMNNGCGRIYYMLKAIISRQPTIDSKNRKKMIKLLVPIVRYTITPPPSPSRWLIKQEGPANPNIVSYDVSLANTTLGPGNSISVPIKLQFHEPKVYLKSIFVGLKEYHELRTNKYETSLKKYIVEELIDANNLPTSAFNEDNNEYFVDVKLNIPFSTHLLYSVDSTYLSVNHKLKIRIRIGKAPDIHFSKIVKIENIVTKNEVFPPPPPKIDNPITKSTPRQNVVKQTPAHSNSTLKPSPKKNSRRLSAFFPLFNKIHVLDPVAQKRISMQHMQNMNGSKSPDLVYNSRSLAFY